MWKNIEDLEDSLNLEELKLILQSSREKELRSQKFFAALKGIDLDKQETKDAEQRFLEVQQRVEARLNGIDEQVYEMNSLGFEVEKEEE